MADEPMMSRSELLIREAEEAVAGDVDAVMGVLEAKIAPASLDDVRNVIATRLALTYSRGKLDGMSDARAVFTEGVSS